MQFFMSLFPLLLYPHGNSYAKSEKDCNIFGEFSQSD